MKRTILAGAAVLATLFATTACMPQDQTDTWQDDIKSACVDGHRFYTLISEGETEAEGLAVFPNDPTCEEN